MIVASHAAAAAAVAQRINNEQTQSHVEFLFIAHQIELFPESCTRRKSTERNIR